VFFKLSSYKARVASQETNMKKIVAAATALLFAGSAAYAAAPEAIHAFAKSCGLPCC
jgi:hypothetical protein